MPRVFFATDLHGSEMCWRKFLNAAKFYEADVLICGGDMTGKAIVPIVEENGHFTFTMAGQTSRRSAPARWARSRTRSGARVTTRCGVTPERLARAGRQRRMRAETRSSR